MGKSAALSTVLVLLCAVFLSQATATNFDPGLVTNFDPGLVTPDGQSADSLADSSGASSIPAQVYPRVQTHRILVNGLWLGYQEAGNGPPIVLVPGSFSDFRIWFNQMEPFSHRNRVIAYSRRYNWPNSAPDQSADGSIGRQVDDLAALIKGLGIAPAHIVGHSYGGSIALLLAVAHPELVRSLVLAEPGVRTVLENIPEAKADLAAFRDFGAAMQQAVASGDSERIVKTLVDFVAPGEFARLPAEIHTMFLANIPAVKVEGNSRFTCGDAHRITVPTLVLTGDRSPSGYRRIADVVASCVFRGDLVTIPNASHPMQFLNPQAFNEAVLAFLAKY